MTLAARIAFEASQVAGLVRDVARERWRGLTGEAEADLLQQLIEAETRRETALRACLAAQAGEREARRERDAHATHAYAVGNDLAAALGRLRAVEQERDEARAEAAEAERVTRVQTAHAVGAVRDAEATKAEASKAVADAEWEYRQLVPVIEGLRAQIALYEVVAKEARYLDRLYLGTGATGLRTALRALDEATTTKGATQG